MPIIELQRRMRQLGEIRIGHTVDTGRVSERTGKPILRPEKLQIFRLTSASRPLLEEVAKLYGGTVQPWTPANGGPAEWEVHTEVDRLPVLVPPREPVTQWYEMYKGSRCERRCDGVTEQKSDKPCMCNPDKRACQITTRLNVMLRDVPGLGVWLLTTHGFYAAAELPEVAHFLASTRGYIDAWLAMEEKQVPIVDERTGKPSVARFMVPKLDVAVTPAQLLAGEGAAAPELAGAGRGAIGAGQPAAIAPPSAPSGPTAEDFLARARAVETFADFMTIWNEAGAAGVSPTPEQTAEMKAIGDRLKAEAEKAKTPAAPPQPAPVPAADPDVLWQQIVAAWPGTTSQLQHEFLTHTGGITSDMAGVADLQIFLSRVKNGDFANPDQPPF